MRRYKAFITCVACIICNDTCHVQAADTVSTEDRLAEAGQHMEQASKLTVRARQFDKAAELLHNTLNMYSEAGVTGTAHGRVVLAFVIVQEQRGDSVAASKVRMP